MLAMLPTAYTVCQDRLVSPCAVISLAHHQPSANLDSVKKAGVLKPWPHGSRTSGPRPRFWT